MSPSIETTHPDVAVVQAGFAAMAQGDVDGFAAMLDDRATWNHHNNDRFAGAHRGRDAILAYLAESMQLTAGTLKPVPLSIMTDGRGTVCIPTRISGSRPDGRRFDDQQVLAMTVTDGKVTCVDQYVGDPQAVAAFWA